MLADLHSRARSRSRPRAAATLAALALCLLAGEVSARSGGISERSGRGETTCSACHSGGVAPVVVLDGPSLLPVGATATFTLSMTGGQEMAGGLDVAATAGTLAVAPGEEGATRILDDELTHAAPRVAAAPSWSFQWTAPAEAGDVTLFAAGNSVDLDTTTAGDAPATTTLLVAVVESCPDVDEDGWEDAACNPDAAADGGDCVDDDREISPSATERCDGADQDCDGDTDEDPLGLLCDDANPCTTDSCADTACVNEANTAPCDDADPCTGDDQCADGACGGTVDVVCDDEDPCTTDDCVTGEGCTTAPHDGVACDDGDPCTTDDTCADGACVPGENLCDCATDDDCAAFETPDDLCDGELFCDTSAPIAVCAVVPDTPVVCDTTNDPECARNTCAPATGLCGLEPRPDETPCALSDSCLLGATCQAGACAGGEVVVCDDENPCTEDRCDPVGGCLHLNVLLPCDDGDRCTEGDQCQAGVCAGAAPLDCSDGNRCTIERCDTTEGCVHEPIAGVPCDDGDACTVDDRCDAGVCVSAGALDCDDGDPCTEDLCETAAGCVHSEPNTPCDDGDACTVDDSCHAGACLPGPVTDCDDGNDCTDDTCDAELGCLSTPNEAPCDDGDPCTLGDQCLGGVCGAGPPRVCNDHDVCTADTCRTDGRCAHTAIERCCLTDPDCPDDQTCVAGSCTGAGPCTPCAEHADCGGPDDLCVQLRDGNFCAVACPEAGCPDGSVCDVLGGAAAQCVPEAGGCLCAPHQRLGCYEQDLYWFDACDRPREVEQICAAGCAAAACLPDESDPGFPIVRPDVVGATDTGPTASGGSGCASTPTGASSPVWSLAALMLAGLIRRGAGRGGRGGRRRAG